jgi:hypothetical protein
MKEVPGNKHTDFLAWPSYFLLFSVDTADSVRSNSEQSRSFVVQELDPAPAVYRSLCTEYRCPCFLAEDWHVSLSVDLLHPFGQPNNARRFFVPAVHQFANNGHVSVLVFQKWKH